MDLFHSDIKRLLDVDSIGDSKFFVTWYDDLSSLSIVKIFKSRSLASGVVKNIIIEIEKESMRKLNLICSDNG